MSRLLNYDGAEFKALPLSALNDDFFFGPLGRGTRNHNGVSTHEAYRLVPVVYRAVDLRARAVSSMPYTLLKGKRDVTDAPEYESLRKDLRDILYRTEASLCLNGASYSEILKNRFGFSSLRWLSTSTIEPQYSPDKGVDWFKRKIGDNEKRLNVDQVWYTFVPSLLAEVGPGTPPVESALAAAGVLKYLQEYLAKYFQRGAIKNTLLQIKGNPPPQEKAKIESFFKRLWSGIGNAHEGVAISDQITPIIIGDGLKDTVNVELNEQQRMDILIALGVPLSVVLSNAANYATSQQDDLHFYSKTVIPQCDLVEDSLNKQLWSRYGLTMDFKPEQLELFRLARLAQAAQVQQIVGKPVLSVNEGRELLGFEPVKDGDEVIHPVPEALDPNSQDDNAESDGTPPSDDKKPDALKDPKKEDLKRWHRKSLKSLKAGKSAAVRFESEYISPLLNNAIIAALELATTPEDVLEVFDAA